MARIDDYIKAVALGKEELIGKDPKQIARRSGAVFVAAENGKDRISIDFLNRKIDISWPDLEFSDSVGRKEVPIQQQVLLLHYLNLTHDIKYRRNGLPIRKCPMVNFIWMRLSGAPKTPWCRVLETILKCW